MLNSQPLATAHDTTNGPEPASPAPGPARPSKALSERPVTGTTGGMTDGEADQRTTTAPNAAPNAAPSAAPSTAPIETALEPDHAALLGLVSNLHEVISRVYRGDSHTVDLVLTALLAGGHVLLEDIPGVGKTTLARALAAAVSGSFRRLQCTPDLMPADITGVSIYDERDRSFHFHPGPVFCNVLLADELNRTPPRTQSALLEAMSEGQVTIDGEGRTLAATFLCIATQNPLDHVGTYPLPDSQKDRFLLCFGLGYPERDQELDLLVNDGADGDLAASRPVVDLEQVQALRRAARAIKVSPAVRGYLLDLINATRDGQGLRGGASPRAALGLQRACQAYALIKGRSFVVPDDIQTLSVPALAHRVTPRVGQEAGTVIRSLVESLPAPR